MEYVVNGMLAGAALPWYTSTGAGTSHPTLIGIYASDLEAVCQSSRARNSVNPATSNNSALCFSFYHSEDMGLGSTGVRVPMRRQHSNSLGI